MILYVVRHGEAVAGNDILQDQWRYLTEKGRATAQRTGMLIAGYGRKARLTITSPLTRAVQTAELASAWACRKNTIIASGMLLPGAGIPELAAYIRGSREAKRVMVVGHEPQLGALVTTLLGQDGNRVALQKGACVALKLHDDDAEQPAAFLWYLPPAGKRIRSFKKAFPGK